MTDMISKIDAKLDNVHDDVLNIKKDYIKKPTVRQILTILALPTAVLGLVQILVKLQF